MTTCTCSSSTLVQTTATPTHRDIKDLIPRDIRIARLLFQEMADVLFSYTELQDLLLKTILEQQIDLGRLRYEAFRALLEHNPHIHLHDEVANEIRWRWSWLEEELENFEERIHDLVVETVDQLPPPIDELDFEELDIDFHAEMHDNWELFDSGLDWEVESTCIGRVVAIWDNDTDSDPIEMYFEDRYREWVPAYNERNYPDIWNHN